MSAGRLAWPKVAARCARQIGRGLVIRLPVKPGQHDLLIDLVAHTAHNLTDFGRGFRNAPLIDDVTDSVHATLLPDRILYFDGTDHEIAKSVRLRAEDWKGRKRRPAILDYELKLAAHSIEAILLE